MSVSWSAHNGILELCGRLKLRGIEEHFEEVPHDAVDFEEYLYQLLQYEAAVREEKSLQNRIRRAHFPCNKFLDELEVDCLPEGMRKRLPELSSLSFIRNGQNVIMTGNPGTGKTHCAIGLGLKACEQGFSVLYTTVPYLVTELKECESTKTLKSYQRRFEKYDLVIADELGYISFDRAGADLLFSNLSLRTVGKSTIITTNLSFERWEEIFGDPVITAAMVDRLTYKAILIDMTGESYRYRASARYNSGTAASK